MAHIICCASFSSICLLAINEFWIDGYNKPILINVIYVHIHAFRHSRLPWTSVVYTNKTTRCFQLFIINFSLFFYLGLWINLFHIKKHQKIEKEQTTQRPKEKRINVQTTIYKATHKTKDLVTRIPRLPVDFSLRVFWRKRTVYLKIFWSFSIETEKNIILHDLIYL